LTARADALFELTDAVWCADRPVRSLVDLALVAEHRRGHGAMYDALGHGRDRHRGADERAQTRRVHFHADQVQCVHHHQRGVQVGRHSRQPQRHRLIPGRVQRRTDSVQRRG
jgi:hypothetical protein